MLNLFNASGLIYAAATYGTLLVAQRLNENNTLQVAVAYCKSTYTRG